MKKTNSIYFLIAFFIFAPAIMFSQHTLTSSMADGTVSHGSSESASATSSSSGSRGKSASTGSYTGPTKEEIFKRHVKNMTNSLLELYNSKMAQIDEKINNISFKNPFEGEGVLSQQIVPNWQETKDQLEDKSLENDYAKLSTESFARTPASDNGYITDPEENYGNSMLADNSNGTTSNETVYSADNLHDSQENMNDNNGFNTVDKAVDQVLDNIEPSLGSRLKMIKDIGYNTVDQFSAQMNNFFDPQGSSQKSEEMFDSYKRQIGQSFAGLIPGVDSFNSTIDTVKEKSEQAKSFLKNLFE